MEISQEKIGNHLVIRLVGRLDANWCAHVENTLTAAVRAGDHRIQLDMSGVRYMSSLGLRVLMGTYKQLKTIKGLFGIINPSETVASVLAMAGMGVLITANEEAPSSSAESAQTFETSRARYDIYPLPPCTGMHVQMLGDPSFVLGGIGTETPGRLAFEQERVALGIGALGNDYSDCAPRLGEFLAVAGTAAYQPSDGSSRPDFVLQEGDLRAEGFLPLGFLAQGSFGKLARFECNGENRSIPLSELASASLEISGTRAAIVVAVTETCGLVGASLRQSPASSVDPRERLNFPKIRDWISFTHERSYRDTTSLIVGVVARGESPLSPLLRPVGDGLLGHFHAASFPYRPLQKGRIDLQASVNQLFEGQNLQAVLHLLSDPREFSGAGQSEFYRGALWVAALNQETLS